jgi:HSP20 family protein
MSLAKTTQPINQWMEEFFRPDWSPFAGLSWKTSDTPAVNIHESKDAYTVEAAIPGFAKEEVRVQVENGMLSISGEQQKKEPESGQSEARTTRREFSYNMFSRAFSLPADADEQQITANYEKGVLHIRIPRRQAAPHHDDKKTIEIR